MAIIKIKGGLGNQMFQYAYGRNLELTGRKIIFDTSFYFGGRAATDTPRKFMLPEFNLQSKAEFSPHVRHLTDILKMILRKFGFPIEEFFQSEKYFINNAEQIQKEFTLKNELSSAAKQILEKTQNTNSVSLHVRRGDYAHDPKTNLHHGLCGLDYYDTAIKTFKENIFNPVFFVFSDDIEWAKHNFIGSEFVFVSNPAVKDCEEMILMSKCKHNIIANSSFSWWGAWLNADPDKIVIAPKKWLAGSNTEYKLPKKWLQI